jgi:cephalosporin hydroxylase
MINKLKNFLGQSRDPALPKVRGSEFEVNSWEISRIVIKYMLPAVGNRPFPLSEQMLIASTLARFEPKYIFEWGTHIGKSARAFYEAARALDLEVTIHSIDLPDDVEHGEHPHAERAKLVRGLSSVRLHQGDGVDTALKILSKLGKNNRTGAGVVFFVDGDHSYESVSRELKAIIKNAPDAVVLLHDTFYQSKDSNYNIGPHEAIKDCLKEAGGRYKRLDTTFGLPGMTLLYPQSADRSE